jgi:hypothetical protein
MLMWSKLNTLFITGLIVLGWELAARAEDQCNDVLAQGLKTKIFKLVILMHIIPDTTCLAQCPTSTREIFY